MTPFRIYEPNECDSRGYPFAWTLLDGRPGVKHIVKDEAERRCVRCRHPYRPGQNAEWSRCDPECQHRGPGRLVTHLGVVQEFDDLPPDPPGGAHLEARWRILTVHHLNGVKADLRWWNLVSLCQRCHLYIQGTVVLERVYPWPHDEWFKPYAAGWYAWAYLREDLSREQVMERLDDLLALELIA